MIIPTYKPGEEFGKLIYRLEEQEYRPDRILVMNTGKQYWNTEWEKSSILEVHHLEQKDFDHGGTRKWAAEMSDADIMVFMTQDALPADRHLIGNLVRALTESEKVGAAYARQLPKKDCRFLEKYTRSFNYPEESSVKRAADIEKYGIKTFFCSNVCAAYDRKVYLESGGFTDRAIFNEDMIYAGTMVKAGYGVAYAADARVYHSHNYPLETYKQRFYDEYKGLYMIHKYVMVKDIPHLFVGYYRFVKNDLKYVNSLNMSSLEKKQWRKYAIKKDWYRFYSAYQAGVYYRSSKDKQEKMDKKFSQQLRQINQ